MLDSNIRNEMIDIYSRCILLGERPFYLEYYFDYIDDKLILTGFVDEKLLLKYWKKNKVLEIPDIFETISLSTNMQCHNNYFRDEMDKNKILTLKFGSNIELIEQLDIAFPYFYKIRTFNTLKIGQDAFKFNRSIFSFEGDNVIEIEKEAFFGCYNLLKVSFHNCLTIGESAFGSCSHLEYVDISSIKKIPRYLCGDCRNLKSFIAPNSISLGDYIITSSMGLERVELGNIKHINKDCFFLCNYDYSDLEKNTILIADNK